MSEQRYTRTYEDFLQYFPDGISGNDINGLGVEEKGPPQPFFWHPADRNPFHELQKEVIDYQRQIPEIAASYSREAPRGPRPVEKAATAEHHTAENWSEIIKDYGSNHEADMIGITPLRPEYVYEGYDIPYPNIILIAVAMEYDKLAAAPSTLDDYTSALEVADKYNNAARAAREIGNFILSSGYNMKSYPGPMATALNMIPAAINAGLGELGKHGNMINREFGSSFRMSAIATDMPLAFDQPDIFGADDFCHSCQVCSKACPPDAIFSDKQMIRGNLKWYVDFDKCIPYFGEALSCGICIAKCPWSRPGVSSNLIQKLAKRKLRKKTQ